MRTLPLALSGALATGGSTSLAKFFVIRKKDGTYLRFSMAQSTLEVPELGELLPGFGVSCGEIAFVANEASAALEMSVSAVPGSPFDFEDLMRGGYDDARLQMYVGDHEVPSRGAVLVFTGWIGSVGMGTSGGATFEARGLLSKTKFLVTEHYTPVCRAYFGDRRCKIPVYPDDVVRNREYAVGEYVRARQGSAGIPSDYANLVWRCTTAGQTADEAPSYAGGVGATVADGDAVFTAENALARHAQVVSSSGFDVVLTGIATPIYPFDLGVLIARSGKNSGKSVEIRTWNVGTQTATCFIEPHFPYLAGDWVEILPGCDYSPGPSGCGRYGNIVNYRGEPFAPDESAYNIDYTGWGS
jgi:hypothetical protein